VVIQTAGIERGMRCRMMDGSALVEIVIVSFTESRVWYLKPGSPYKLREMSAEGFIAIVGGALA
jgi:hypothetical protein